jgi:hypothetical protein
MKFAGWFGLIVLVLSTIFIVDYFAYPNVRICNQMTKGITEPELTRRLGSFLSERDLGNGQWMLYYESHPVAAGLIRARVAKDSGAVLELQCTAPPNFGQVESCF